MVTELVRSEDHILWGLILDSFLEMATSTLVTPCPMLSFMTYFRSSIEMIIPSPG